MAIPLLMQNQAPEGFEDGDLVKVDLRPESVRLKDRGGAEGFRDAECVKTDLKEQRIGSGNRKSIRTVVEQETDFKVAVWAGLT